MTIMLPALAIAFAAFCVWLTVRIVNRRERWAKWTALAMVMVVLYLAGIGPAAWLYHRTQNRAIGAAYLPVTWSCEQSQVVRERVGWYARRWVPVTMVFGGSSRCMRCPGPAIQLPPFPTYILVLD